MKALVLYAPGDARIEDRPDPEPPGPGDVTLKVLRTGLCGTDASEYAAGPVMTPLTAPHPVTGVLGGLNVYYQDAWKVAPPGTFVFPTSLPSQPHVWPRMNEALWLDRGKLMMRGRPGDVVNEYMKFVNVKKRATAMEDM